MPKFEACSRIRKRLVTISILIFTIHFSVVRMCYNIFAPMNYKIGSNLALRIMMPLDV